MAQPWTEAETKQIEEQYRRRGWARCPADNAVLKARPVGFAHGTGSIRFECLTCDRHSRIDVAA